MAPKRSQITQPTTRSRLGPSTTSSWRQLAKLGPNKTDVLDCQRIQKLRSFAQRLLSSDQQIRELRTYMRLLVSRTEAVHQTQKALFEMNAQLTNVISDLTGETGLQIVQAIIAGERDPQQFAALCSSRIKASRERVYRMLPYGQSFVEKGIHQYELKFRLPADQMAPKTTQVTRSPNPCRLARSITSS
jgi:hypothetical protein